MSDLVTRFQLAVAALRGRLQSVDTVQAQLGDCQAELALVWGEYRQAVETLEEMAGSPDGGASSEEVAEAPVVDELEQPA